MHTPLWAYQRSISLSIRKQNCLSVQNDALRTGETRIFNCGAYVTARLVTRRKDQSQFGPAFSRAVLNALNKFIFLRMRDAARQVFALALRAVRAFGNKLFKLSVTPTALVEGRASYTGLWTENLRGKK